MSLIRQGVFRRSAVALAKRVAYSTAPRTEPAGPSVKTAIPGPKSLALLEQLNTYQAAQNTHFFVDYDKSFGNYIVDADGNVMLDFYTQIATTCLGYNHPAFIEAITNSKNLIHLVNRPALGSFPSIDWPNHLNNSLISIAPKGMKNVTTMGCGACAVENAFKTVFFTYMRKQRKGEPPTEQELISCMANKEPGCPPLSILSFNRAFHGRTTGCMSASHTKWVHKLDYPNLDWPYADFPYSKYPLEDNKEANAKEEKRCLEQVREKFHEYNKAGKPVAGVIVEPIQGEGGDNYASEHFFRELQRITKENGAYFIVDEVQTSASVGRWWYHENWNLPSPPDVVTFSKKTQTGGFYHTDEMRQVEPYRIYNTWMGDPAKVVLLEALVKTIQKDGLFDKSAATGKYAVAGLQKLQSSYPNIIQSPRGVGVLIAFDAPSVKIRDDLIAGLKKKGVHCSASGAQTLRLRPTLIYEKKHVDIFLNALNDVARTL